MIAHANTALVRDALSLSLALRLTYLPAFDEPSIGSTTRTGVPLISMHFTGVAALRRHAALRNGPIKASH